MRCASSVSSSSISTFTRQQVAQQRLQPMMSIHTCVALHLADAVEAERVPILSRPPPAFLATGSRAPAIADTCSPCQANVALPRKPTHIRRPWAVANGAVDDEHRSRKRILIRGTSWAV